MMRPPIEPPAAQQHIVMAVLLGTAAACWVILLTANHIAGSGNSMGLPTMGLRAPAFLLLWVVMTVAMMFPSAAPMILTFDRVQSGRRRRGQGSVPTWLFVAGYLIVWIGAGVVAYVVAAIAEIAAARIGLSGEAAARVGGGLIIAAGLYQAGPLKEICLSQCRSPLAFVLNAWRDGRLGALRMGVAHGGFCLGCCWMLMAVLFPLGVMSIAAMNLVAVLIFAEKTVPWGRPGLYATSAAMVLYGAAVLAWPDLLPSFGGGPAATPGIGMPVVPPTQFGH